MFSKRFSRDVKGSIKRFSRDAYQANDFRETLKKNDSREMYNELYNKRFSRDVKTVHDK